MHKSSVYKTIKDLFEKMKEAGLTGYSSLDNFREFWIGARSQNGTLVLPRGGKNKRYYLLTTEQIDQIIEAFKPGGPGKWDYRNV